MRPVDGENKYENLDDMRVTSGPLICEAAIRQYAIFAFNNCYVPRAPAAV